MLDFLDTKKKLPGERKPVFPDGVPGLEQGVPKELYKGAAQEQRAAERRALRSAAAPRRSRNEQASSPRQGQAADNGHTCRATAARRMQRPLPRKKAAPPLRRRLRSRRSFFRKRTTAPPPDEPAAQLAPPPPPQPAHSPNRPRRHFPRRCPAAASRADLPPPPIIRAYCSADQCSIPSFPTTTLSRFSTRVKGAGNAMSFTIAIIGRPNVGKSTLFNRLVGQKLALVDDEPGVTRDRREGQARLGDLDFTIIDTAGLDEGPRVR